MCLRRAPLSRKKFAGSGVRHLKLVVKDNKTTMTAAPTKVKEITLTFSKAVADTAAAKITVKKGNVTPTYSSAKWADDAKSVVLAMDSKLTAGTYDVTVSGIEAADLTASIAVENQRLDKFVLISNELVADYKDPSKATISFKAVDQYGERISCTDVNVNVTLGDTKGKYQVPSNKDTTVEVTNINSVLRIAGQSGKITIVDSNSGKSLVEDITYQPAAKATKVEVVGIYDKSGKKVETLTAGKSISGYKVAFKFYDQYAKEQNPVAMSADAAALKDIQCTVVGGTTTVTGASILSKAPLGGTEYAVCELAAPGNIKAGSFQITVVNTKHGLLDTFSYIVENATVIKEFSVSQDSDVYAGESAELSYTAIDTNGNEVKDYNVLKQAFEVENSMPASVTLKKQADGSAKMMYKYEGNIPNATTGGTMSVNEVLTFQLYKNEIYTVVKNATVRVNQARDLWEVTGVNKATAGVAGTKLTFKAEDFKIIDQYGNTLTKTQINDRIKAGNVISFGAITGAAWTLSGATTGLTTATDEFIAEVGSDTVKIPVNVKSQNKNDEGIVLALSCKDADKATDFEIKWNNGVNHFYAENNVAIDKSKFEVYGKVDGQSIKIPAENYEITGVTGNAALGKASEKGEKTVDGTVTVSVSTKNDNKYVTTSITGNFTCSNKASAINSIKANSADLAAGSKLDVAGMAKGFDFKDQYGKTINASDLSSYSVTASVVVLSAVTGSAIGVKYDGTNKCEVVDATVGDVLFITMTKGDLTATREVTLK